MAFKFIHAADIHLDSPLRGLSEYDDAPVSQLRNASREALKQLVTCAITEQVSFVIFAGDLYDGEWRDYNTGIFFATQMGRLAKAGVRAFILRGNHDAESEITRALVLPPSVYTFSARSAEVIRLDDLKVALHGRSFANKAVDENLAATYKAKVNDYFNIGVLHTALEGYAAHPNYAPCTLDELHSKGYDYWALGHVHEFQQWDGPSTIVFPGNLQGRHVRETGRKGAVIVTVSDSGSVQVDRLFIDVLRWEILRVDVSECLALEDAVRKVGDSLGALLESDSVPRAVRVVLEGQTSLHGVFSGNSAHLRAQVLAQVVAVDAERLWLEKVQLATRPLESSTSGGANQEVLTELQLIFSEAGENDDFLQQLQAQFQPFKNRVPNEVSDDVPLLSLAREGRWQEILKEVSPTLLAQLNSKVN
jgi:DNA repair exonuclease SbcCD nuclease subunit